MDKGLIDLLFLVTILCVTGTVNSTICGSNCLNSTDSPADSPCNETSGECLFGCVSGFTGDSCLIPCGENCVNCSLTSDDGSGNETICHLCNLDYYTNGSSCAQCSSNCELESNASACNQEDGYCEFGCKREFYGEQCDKNCSSNCLKNDTSGLASCDRNIGACTFGCVSSFYGNHCDLQCSLTCRQNDSLNATLCRQSDGYCDSGCQEGWFSTHCNKTCSAGCAADNSSTKATCRQDNGVCDFGCLDKYYSILCNETCSPFCQQSNDSSRTCSETTGHCLFSCVNGYYGPKCDKQCSAGCALNDTSDLQNNTAGLPICDPANGTCTFGCDYNWYLPDCSGRCNQNCLQNSSLDIRACDETNGHCIHGCKPTFHLPKCDEPCDNKCLYSLCERDGTCSVGCRFAVLGGPRCDQACSTGCNLKNSEVSCDQNMHCTEGCKDNFWGPTCVPCSSFCLASASLEPVCNDINGFCKFGCKTNRYGITCSETCSEHCKDSLCNQTTGECTNTCNKGHFGDYCNNSCSQNCPDNDCYSTNGTCVAEICQVNDYAWHGPSCNQRCPSNCKDKICHRDNGTCSKGCVAGYFGNICDRACPAGTYGENCAQNCSQGCVNGTCNADDGQCDGNCVEPYKGAKCDTFTSVSIPPPPVPTLAIVIGGVALLIIVVGTVFLCVWRKKKKKEIVRRRKPKNRQAFSEIFRKTFFSKSMAGPKRLIIDNLLDRVKEMSTTDFESDFNDIEDASCVEKTDSVAKLPENLAKNCFLDVYPFDENRVVLRSLDLQGSDAAMTVRYRKTMDIILGLQEMAAVEPDYINASFIEGYASSKQRYIASQGPIGSTMNDFWRMVVQEKVSVIVMLTALEERGLFRKYWPDIGCENLYGKATVRGVKEELYADFTVRTLEIKCYDETRSVTHLQFTSWPSEGVPPTAAGMVEFYHKFLSVEPEADTPTVVHCTSGVGRTGCFIALDLLVDEGNEDHSVDVSQCVTKLRGQRVNMVQSQDQYEFLYKTLTQVLSLRSYPVDKANCKKELKELKKENGKLLQTTFESLCESVALDEIDVESVMKNQGEEGKNREGSDVPEDRYRPKLASGDYINAVYIDTYKKTQGIIVTQMPTPETVNQFLRLILQEQCNVVVMMNEENSDDKSQFKYWPAFDKATQIGDVFVTTTEIIDKVSYIAINLTLSDLRRDDDHTFKVQLYQFTDWKPGNKCPKSEVTCLSLIREVLKKTSKNYAGRILVHCLNGSERSGLFCSMYNLLEKLNYEGAISVVNTVRQIKSRRANAVKTLEQFRFIYECLVYYIENYEDDIKYKPEEKVQKRSVASNAMKRISQMYSKPNKKKKSDLYAKPNKKKTRKVIDEENQIGIEEPRASGGSGVIAVYTRESGASGSSIKAVYAAVDKDAMNKKDSKSEVSLYDNVTDEERKNNEVITVTKEN